MNIEKSKRILVIGINFEPELTGIGKYNGEMVSWLADNGYDCTVVTGFPYYPHWKIQTPYKGSFYRKEISKEGKIRVYRCPLFVPQSPSGLKRIFHEASFFISAFLVVLNLLFKPKNDYIFCAAPPFHLGFLGLFYRFFKGGKMIYHIQDLQVDAAQDLGMIKSQRLISTLFKLENYILSKTNEVSSISKGMIGKIKQKIDKDVHLFPNWVDTRQFHPIPKTDEAKERYGFVKSDKIILYSGSIGEKQGLESIIQIAREMKGNSSFKFLICGSGPYKNKLMEIVKESKLTNIHFLPLQPIEEFNQFFNIADVHLVIQKNNISDLVMPSKLTTILAIGGLAVVTSNPGSSLYEVVKEHEMGILVKAEDTNELLQGIKFAVTNDNRKIRLNARRYAEEYLSHTKVLNNFYNNRTKNN